MAVVAGLAMLSTVPPAGAAEPLPVLDPKERLWAFGDAGFFGSTRYIPLSHPLVGSTGAVATDGQIVPFAATSTGKGYWMAVGVTRRQDLYLPGEPYPGRP